MFAIIKAMSREEKLRILEDTAEEALMPKLLELEKLAKEHCCFPKLSEVLDLLELN